MKKYTALFLILALIFNVCPISLDDLFGFSTEVNAAETDKPVLIYMAEDFETQEIGKTPYGFRHYIGNNTACYGDVFARGGNSSNKVAVFAPYNDPTDGNIKAPCSYLPFYYAPLEHEYVMDFKFYFENNAGISIQATTNASSINEGRFCPVGVPSNGDTSFIRRNVLGISDKIVVKLANNVENTIKTGIARNTWHRFQMKHNFDTDKVDIYLDGALVQSNVDFYPMDNNAAYRFYGSSNAKVYLDDINVYLSDKIITDAELASTLEGYTNSGIRPDPRYQTGFLAQYSGYVYDMFYNEFVMSGMSSRRVYRNNRFYDLPISTYIENDITYVPIRAFAEMMGATVGYDNGVVSITHNGKTMRVEEGKNFYYVDNKVAPLRYPIKMVQGHATINLDILCNFLEIEYTRYENLSGRTAASYDIISFTGELDTEYSLLGRDDTTNAGRTLRYELIGRMMELLQNDMPSPETLLSIYRENYPTGAHPHVLINDFDEIKAGLNKGDSKYNAFYNNFISQANSVLNTPLTRAGIIANGGGACRNLLKVAFAWNVTQDTKYLTYINNAIDVLYENVTTATLPNSLSQGTACIGLGTLYDWMYNTLSTTDTTRLNNLKIVVKTMGIDWFDARYNSPTHSATSVGYSYGNQALIINTGAIISCLALMDEYPEEASRVLSQAIKHIVPSFRDFAPYGQYSEGLSYWQYVCSTMPLAINSLNTAFGTDFGIYSMQGVNQTSNFPLSIKGPGGIAYITGDGVPQTPYAAVYMFEAKMNNDVSKALLRRNNMITVEITDIINWVFLDNPDIDVQLPTDAYSPKIENVLLKTDNSSAATSVLLHGGGVDDGHGHEDNGTFMFDMIGYNWAADLGREDYNIYQFGSYTQSSGTYTGYTSFDYYRNNAEGHNTVIANYGASRFAMESKAQSKIIKFDASDTMSYGIVDMTQTNNIYSCATRGIKLDKVNNEILIHDSFKATEPTDFYWLMHTQADIEVAADGRSAILSTNDGTKRIWMGIVSDDNYVIENMAPEHLGDFPKAAEGEIMRPSGYENSIIRPPLESTVSEPFDPNAVGAQFATKITKGFRRLTIRTTQDTDHFKLMVAFKPLENGENVPATLPTAIPMELWSN